MSGTDPNAGGMMSSEAPGPTIPVRLVFADQGTFHAETVHVQHSVLSRYDRLIDLLREEESVTQHMYLDMQRLVSAYVVGDDTAG